MLTAKDIAERIHQPSLIQREDIPFLGELTSKFPYTQIYSILYLKGLGDAKDVQFEAELQKHSFRIGDRSQLFKLVHDFSNKEFTESTIESPELKETIAEIEIKEDIIIEKTEVSEISEEDIHSETLSEVEVIDLEQVILIEPEEIQVTEETIVSEGNIIAESNSTIEIPIDALEESILHHTYAANYQLPDLTDSEIEALEERKSAEIESSEPEIAKIPIEEIEIDTKLSFTSWLNSNKNKIEHFEHDKLKIDAIVNDSSLTFEINEFFGEVVKPKKEFFSPIKKAKESLKEDGLPVSETLAKIYALQGNFPKAIYAYEQLSLKYPEKKIFFAIQIKDLQKKLNT